MIVSVLTVAVPFIAPVNVLSVNPDGSSGVTLNDRGAVPPVAVTGVNAHGAPSVQANGVLTTAVINVGFTVSNNALLDAEPNGSVAVTVNEVCA